VPSTAVRGSYSGDRTFCSWKARQLLSHRKSTQDLDMCQSVKVGSGEAMLLAVQVPLGNVEYYQLQDQVLVSLAAKL
jgi:hypothetical protein